MSGYERPAIDVVPVLDETGAPIPYGARWGSEGPPPETYSVDAHPERFAPLHAVADALVAHLVATRSVRVEHDAADVLLQRWPHLTMTRDVELRSTSADAAPIAIGWTDYPGIALVAGAWHVRLLPVCGCDACDDAWEPLADELEGTVLAVADGGLQEQRDGAFSIWHTDGDGMSSSTPPGVDLEPAARRRGLGLLEARSSARWLPWPTRQA